MDYAIDDVGQVGMGGGVRGFKAAALINCNVNHDRTLLHARKHFAGNQFRRSGTWNEHGTNDSVGRKHFVFSASMVE